MPSVVRLAIIPARGGSKRMPGKNIRDFCGRPMIHWPISVARDSNLFDHIVVSTDSPEVAEVAVAGGADVPFVRPADLADDHTPLRPVIRHAIEASEAFYGLQVDFACSILATAPFLCREDILAGTKALSGADVDFAFAATGFPFPIQRALKLSDNGGVEMLQPEYRYTRSQDLEECFYDAAQFYWGTRSAFISDQPMYSTRSRPVLLPQHKVRDIDTPEDWHEAEILMKMMQERSID